MGPLLGFGLGILMCIMVVRLVLDLMLFKLLIDDIRADKDTE